MPTNISVIIPVYRPKNLDALKRSIKANAAADVEWIVVDDGSGPTFEEVLSELEADTVMVVRLPKNGRQGAARNEGLARANGAWIKFLDADDELDVGHLRSLLEVSRSSTGIAFAPTRHIYANGTYIDNDSWVGIQSDSAAQLERMIHSPFLSHCGALFPRDLLLQIGGYDESLVTDEDGDLLLRILQTGAHFVGVPSVRYHYHHNVGEERVSNDVGEEKLRSRIRVCEKLQQSYKNSDMEMPATVKRALALRLDKIALSFWKNERETARNILAQAQEISPGYTSSVGPIKHFVRCAGGPGLTIAIANLYRKLRRRTPQGT